MLALAPDALLLPDWCWIILVVIIVAYLSGVRVEVGEPESEEDRRVRRAVEAYVTDEIDVEELELRLDAILRPRSMRRTMDSFVVTGPNGEQVEVRYGREVRPGGNVERR